MSKMSELSISEQEDAYAEYIEAQRQELREEGAEELRIDILRAIDAQMTAISADPSVSLGLTLAKDIVKRAFI